jgi:protein-L-isoaspartate(D-aspartate) O-methyltransferase
MKASHQAWWQSIIFAIARIFRALGGWIQHPMSKWPPFWLEITNPAVLDAIKRVPRHQFVPDHLQDHAYEDRPLPIGQGQTISQPFVVALMTQALDLTPESKVLEIGTGSGYQTAILAELAGDVYTVEVRPELQERARRILEDLGYTNIHYRVGDGWEGWPEQAPFDAIIVTAAAPEWPRRLIDQLANGGRMVIPVGDQTWNQTLWLLTKLDDSLIKESLGPVRFVPLIKPDQNPDA